MAGQTSWYRIAIGEYHWLPFPDPGFHFGRALVRTLASIKAGLAVSLLPKLEVTGSPAEHVNICQGAGRRYEHQQCRVQNCCLKVGSNAMRSIALAPTPLLQLKKY